MGMMSRGGLFRERSAQRFIDLLFVWMAVLIASPAVARAEAPQNRSRGDHSGGLAMRLEKDFATPPDSAKPWVYSFWLEGNVTREGITADLEAMKRAGIGGLLFMDGEMGNPKGPLRFMSQPWRAAFKHLLAEADRLGLQVNLNNDPGWAGSGGPWVKPQQAAQKVVMSEIFIDGPSHFDAILTQPPATQTYYEDIAVLACPAPVVDARGEPHRIADFNSTKSFAGGRDFYKVVPWPRFIPTNAAWPVVPIDQCVSSAQLRDITLRMAASGRLTWDVPAGRWLVLRIGHTLAGGTTRASQQEASGLECDKLSKTAIEVHFAAMVKELVQEAGPLAGKVLISTHVDSWEAGSGNWTAGFREEFRRRRGYDLLPFLPTLNGLVVDTLEVSERFLWDFRETVCELLLENYAGHLAELAHKQGLRLSIEAYDGTCDDLRYAGRADEPMSEFWQRGCYSGLPLCDLTEEIASAAHVYGKPIVGAEAFTAWSGDFLDHPATLKSLGDWAFCTGVNRFVFSEWIMQPRPQCVPGVSFYSVGTVFSRAVTWWEQSKPWHEYVARCQHVLRQGRFVADVCFLAPEGAPYRFVPPIPANIRGVIPDRPEYNFDGCPAELVLKGMTVRDGRVALPSGMSYPLLVLPTYNADGQPVVHVMESDYIYKPAPLPKIQTMTPQLLRRVKELVTAGATVLGTRPLESPSLAGFPACDQELIKLADELWGKGAGTAGAGERRVGEGRIIWGTTPEQVLAGMNLPPDFACDPAVKGKLNYTHRQLEDGTELYFVANKLAAAVEGTCSFRSMGRPEFWWPQTGRITRIAAYEKKGGVTKVPISLEPNESVFVVFRTGPGISDPIVSIAKDGQSIFSRRTNEPKIVVEKAAYGVPGDSSRLRDVRTKLQTVLDEGVRRIQVNTLAEGDDPAFSVTKTIEVEYTIGGKVFKVIAQDPQSISFGDTQTLKRTADVQLTDDGQCMLEAWENGRYDLRTAAGKRFGCTASNIPAIREIIGPWEVTFPPRLGAPDHVTFDKLISWSLHGDPGVRYFSGTATYSTTFDVPAEIISKSRALYLDLGNVAVIAQVKVNGRDLGILWKEPFRVEIGEAVRAGNNTLDVKVTNLWVNRLIGDEQLPEDSDRFPNGLLKAWPQWVLEGKPSPAGRLTFVTCRIWSKDSPLQQSGLLGPVKLIAAERMVCRESME